MWLRIFFSFFVAAYAYSDYPNRINQDNFAAPRIIKCKTPLVPEGQCVPLTDCTFLISRLRNENDFVSFTLTGDRCGYHFGRLHACCPLIDEQVERKAVTLEPVIGSEPKNTFVTFGTRRTTRDVEGEFGYTESDRAFRFRTSTTRRTPVRDFDGGFESTDRGPITFSTSTTRRTPVRDFDGGFESTDRRPLPFLTSTSKRTTLRNTDEEFRSTERPIQNSNNNPAQHPNMRLLPEDDCGPYSYTNKVIGGTTVDIDEFPWTSMLLYRNAAGRISNQCGGALISARYVLTAAHCVSAPDLRKERLTLHRVRLGEWDISTAEDCQGPLCNKDGPQEIEIEETVIHPKYEPASPGKPYDIALIRLKKEARFNNFIKAVCLPFGDSGVYKEKLIVAGWGRTSNRNGKGSNKLQQVAVPVVDKEPCTAFYKNYNGQSTELTESQICAGGEDGKDSCQGDSGGPLIGKKIIDQQPRWQILGVVSFGPRSCGVKDQPGVYTKVSSFLDWILDNMKS